MLDPEFEPGTVHTAVLTISNPTSWYWEYDVELFLAGTSLKSQWITLDAHERASLSWNITMPDIAGTYSVYALARCTTTGQSLGRFDFEPVTIAPPYVQLFEIVDAGCGPCLLGVNYVSKGGYFEWYDAWGDAQDFNIFVDIKNITDVRQTTHVALEFSNKAYPGMGIHTGTEPVTIPPGETRISRWTIDAFTMAAFKNYDPEHTMGWNDLIVTLDDGTSRLFKNFVYF